MNIDPLQKKQELIEQYQKRKPDTVRNIDELDLEFEESTFDYFRGYDDVEGLIFKQVEEFQQNNKDFYDSYYEFLPKFEQFQKDYEKFLDGLKQYKSSTK